jgi:hypothetical protein
MGAAPIIAKKDETISSAQEQRQIKQENPTIKDIINGNEGWYRLAFFLLGIPLSMVVLFIYLIGLFLPSFVAIPIGSTIGLLLTIMYLDKLKVMLK